MNPLSTIRHYVTAPFRLLLQWPAYLIAAPRKIWGLSPPARAAVLTLLAWMLCIVVVVAVYYRYRVLPFGANFWTPLRILGMVFVSATLPVSVYFIVRHWLEPEISRFPDIDAAWKEGLRQLEENGIDLRSRPLYLILGIPDGTMCDSLFAAARLKGAIPRTPSGPQAPLHWFATEDAIYLACTGTGRLGRISYLAKNVRRHAHAQETLGGGEGFSATGTLIAGSPAGSALFDPLEEDLGKSLGPSATETIRADATYSLTPEAGRTIGAPTSARLSREDRELATERIEDVFQRLRLARQPYCANNGVLLVVPRGVLANASIAEGAPEAVSNDLKSLNDSVGVASAVTMLVAGMEEEQGFPAFVQRIAVGKARDQRVGKKHNVWNAASDENLDALSSHACGSIEDLIYREFANADALGQPSNGKLYELLCRVRRDIQPRIRRALVGGYAAPTENGAPRRLFSGCYFAATGKQSDQQAFVYGVFDKLHGLSNDLQWSDQAWREEERYRTIGKILEAVNAILLIVLGWLIYDCITRAWWH